MEDTDKKLTTYVILDDDDTFGGPGTVVQVDEEGLTDPTTLDLESGRIDSTFKEVESGLVKGRTLDIMGLIECFDLLKIIEEGEALSPGEQIELSKRVKAAIAKTEGTNDEPTDNTA